MTSLKSLVPILLDPYMENPMDLDLDLDPFGILFLFGSTRISGKDLYLPYENSCKFGDIFGEYYAPS